MLLLPDNSPFVFHRAVQADYLDIFKKAFLAVFCHHIFTHFKFWTVISSFQSSCFLGIASWNGFPVLIGSVVLVNLFSDKCLSKVSLRPTEQCSDVTGNPSAFETGTLNITAFYYLLYLLLYWAMVIFFLTFLTVCVQKNMYVRVI